MSSGKQTCALITGASALVSGATGFLGGRLAVRLLQAGFRVRVLARCPGQVEALRSSGVEVVLGDLDDQASLLRAVRGQTYVFHTAGKVSDWGKRADFFRVNADGASRLLDACRKASVQRLVHVSSLTVLGLPRDAAPVDETTPCVSRPKDDYSASKIAAEMHMRRAWTEPGPEVTIVRPGVIWGRGERTIVPRIAALLRRRRMVYIGRAANILALSQVDNLCSGLILAATTPAAAGQIYHITDDEEISAKTAISAIAAAMGLPAPRLSLPYWLVLPLAALMEGVARLGASRNPPLLTRYGVRLVACDSRYDIGKARRELGYQPEKSFRQGLAELDFPLEPR